MTAKMQRRDFITFIGGAAAAWPLAARAQRPMPVIGLLRSSSSVASPHLVTGLLQGLKEAGFVDGQDCAIEYRWGDNQLDRLPALVADLLRRPVAVIVVDTPSALAAKAATTTVPIVFVTGADPIRVGLVASLNPPGGNVTGVSFFSVELGAKRLGLLRELRPEAARIAVLVDSKWPLTERFVAEVRAAASAHWAANRSPLCQQRPRNRDRLYNARPTWGCRVARRHWHVLELPTGTDCRASGPT
jgi:ABC-type uncharacterized transport system substrate-binding protein